MFSEVCVSHSVQGGAGMMSFPVSMPGIIFFLGAVGGGGGAAYETEEGVCI